MTTPASVTTGFGALQQHIKEAAERSASMGGGKLRFFKLQTNEQTFVRFLTDDIKTAKFAEGVTGVDGKKNGFLIDPDNNLVTKYAHPGAWDGKIKTKTVGVAVRLEQRLIPPATPEDRPRYEYVDKITKRDDGSSEREFLVVLQAHGNFWDKMVGFHGVYHTICDRPYSITKTGVKLDVDYQIVPVDIPADDPLRDPKVVLQHYGYGRPWDEKDPNRFWWCPQTLDEWILDYGSESRIKHFLVGPSGGGNGAPPAQPPYQPPTPPGYGPPPVGSSTPPAAAPPQPTMQTPDDFNDLRARLNSNPPPTPPVGSGPPPIDPTGLNDQGEPPF